jgi:hypothetical protein
MNRITAKLFAVTFALAALLHGTPLHAAPFSWLSSTGTGGACSAAQPCGDVFTAIVNTDAGGQINCLNSPGIVEGAISTPHSLTIDCVGSFNFFNGGPQLTLTATNQVFKVRNLTFTGVGGGTTTAIKVTGSGTLILENCAFENMSGTALDIEPAGALNLVIKNSRISNDASGVLIKPAAGGSVTATFDGVTIVNNTGGGIKTDTTNGPVSVDISNSAISNNGGNGMNAVSGAGGANMFNIRNSVIARNGAAGVQANGANAAALVNNTLLDSNTAGAISAVAGGRILTYGNNSTIGPAGSGFTGTAPPN